LEDTAFRAMGNELQMMVTQSRSIEIRSFSDVFIVRVLLNSVVP
jgi:hypothetical protein